MYVTEKKRRTERATEKPNLWKIGNLKAWHMLHVCAVSSRKKKRILMSLLSHLKWKWEVFSWRRLRRNEKEREMV